MLIFQVWYHKSLTEFFKLVVVKTEVKKFLKNYFQMAYRVVLRPAVSASNVEVLNLKLVGGEEVAICVIMNPPDDSDVHQSLKTTD